MMTIFERKTPRNFHVRLVDKNGNAVTFNGTKCIVNNDNFKQRLGIGDVSETISCKSFELIHQNKKVDTSDKIANE